MVIYIMLHINLICIGDKLPVWLNTGIAEYVKRLKPFCRFKIIELKHIKRPNERATAQCIKLEGERMLQKIPKDSQVIALDQRGKAWSSENLAMQLQEWQTLAQPISLLIGGADGLAPACLERAQTQWSLSNLTLPHSLARLLVVEQCYRAFSFLVGHPYHR